MAESRISYLNRTYEDYENSIIDITQKYYSDIFHNYNDAGIGRWLMQIPADIADNLSYNIDRAYQETDINSATSRESLLNIARTNGLKIPGSKSAIVEVELSCKIPLDKDNQSIADEKYYAPIIKRGTQFTNGVTTFELVSDVNFAEQFDENGFSNRKIVINRDGNSNIINYTYTKTAIAVAGYTKIYSRVISNSDIKPFLSFTISDGNITNIESIIFKQGTFNQTTPQLSEFYVDEEMYYDRNNKLPVQRYFEVDNLCEQYRYGYVVDTNEENGYYEPEYVDSDYVEVTDENGDIILNEEGDIMRIPIRRVMKGKWKRLKNKFTTEFTDKGGIKITFGSGLKNIYGDIPTEASEFTKYMMARMEANDYLGVLPESGTTMYVLYRVGGGEISNIGAHTLTTISNLNVCIDGDGTKEGNDIAKITSVKNSIKVTNPSPSYGGKDAPSDEEIKYLIKYNNATQNRCVTLKDYYSKINQIHPKYGCPFRHSVVEENNKVIIYTLGLDYQGKLKPELSEAVAENMIEYLKQYKCVNDFVEIRSGKVINLSFDINVYLDKTYDKSEVINRIITFVKDYMDIRKHIMGEDIFLGDLEKEISKLDGVINLISLRCYNKKGEGYSSNEINQSFVNTSSCHEIERVEQLGGGDDYEIDLNSSDKTLFSSIDTMFEIKYPSKDIKIRIKQR